MKRILNILKRSIPYILVATLASTATWFAADRIPNSKLERLAYAIDSRFIGTADETAMEDAAAEAMIGALGDRWSYYVSAEEYAAHRERQGNSYVGIGVTIRVVDNVGIEVVEVTGDGPAQEAGIRVGDVITCADGNSLAGLDMTQARDLIMGEENTQVVLTLLREGQTLEVPVTRRTIRSKAAQGQMLSEDIGYIAIKNFHAGAGSDTIAQVETLLEAGAKKLIFDVRNNPGGYVHEMVEVLDYLLPEGPLFRSVSYTGRESVEESDADCLDLPMVVLINGNTYSAAEFFAAALSEYEWATLAGEPTGGKGYYQTTIELGDGSAVQLSTGAYTTPNGVNLAEVGGLQPDIPVELTETAASVMGDPQILAAVDALDGESNG